jgi:Skp family chaperone for outer membrane proteins
MPLFSLGWPAFSRVSLTKAEQRDLEKRHKQDQKEIKALKQDLARKEKALADAAALLIAAKNIQAFWREDGED